MHFCLEEKQDVQPEGVEYMFALCKGYVGGELGRDLGLDLDLAFCRDFSFGLELWLMGGGVSP